MRTLLGKAALVFVAVFLLASLGSCGGSSGAALGDLLVANSFASFEAIDFVMALSGPEPLTSAVFITPGDSYTFFGVIAGVYDIEVHWTDATSDVFFGVFVPAGGTGSLTGLN